jgi:hypothetical protein
MADFLNSSLLRNIISKVLMLIVATTFFFASSAQTFTILDDFEDGTFDGGTGNSAAVWTVLNGGFTVANSVLGNSHLSRGLSNTDLDNRISTPFTKVCDAWEFEINPESTTAGQFDAYFFYMTDASSDPALASGYYVAYNHSDGKLSLRRMDNGNIGNVIISANRGFSTSTFIVKVTRSNNNWTLFINNSSVGTGFEATYPPNICAYQGVWISVISKALNDIIDNIKYAEVAGCTTGTQEICGNGVDDDCDGLTDNVYRFVGDGNFSVDANWQCGSAPPNPLPENTFVIIDPQVNGRCNLDIEYTVSPKAKFTVAKGKELLLPGNLIMQ